ncbi:hypothetical protein HLH36_11850 [Gluconacetobacter aggeris]|uniref:Transposase n=1 Tax=Gluconacetobacter aggeris TaxID=1286186 RepID=A0A7W4IU04_9PROT|nr:hypothetical protein [Gluconacetobacter aggeris]MBB2169044.1 hypothetical protein [Gluconacetobacter aggeris]
MCLVFCVFIRGEQRAFKFSVIRWVAEWRASGREHAPRQGDDRRSHRIEAWSGVLLAAIEARADISLIALAEKLATEHGVRFAPSTIWRCLDRHDMIVKKTAHASEQTRPDVAERREAWFDSQPDLDRARLVFMDETAVSTKMARLRGCLLNVNAKGGWRWRAYSRASADEGDCGA